jgi:excisionase family DNA binding protein
VTAIEASGRSSSRLLTAEEVAGRWQATPAHVYRLGRDGVIPVVRIGRLVRFRLEAIEQFELEGGASG